MVSPRAVFASAKGQWISAACLAAMMLLAYTPALRAKGQNVEALAEFKEAMHIGLNDPMSYVNASAPYVSLRKCDEAAGYFQKGRVLAEARWRPDRWV